MLNKPDEQALKLFAQGDALLPLKKQSIQTIEQMGKLTLILAKYIKSGNMDCKKFLEEFTQVEFKLAQLKFSMFEEIGHKNFEKAYKKEFNGRNKQYRGLMEIKNV